jgi:hypothetical protein
LTDHRLQMLTAGGLPESTGPQEAQHRAAAILGLPSAGPGLHPGNVRWIQPDRVGGDRLPAHDDAPKARQDHFQGPEQDAMNYLFVLDPGNRGTHVLMSFCRRAPFVKKLFERVPKTTTEPRTRSFCRVAVNSPGFVPVCDPKKRGGLGDAMAVNSPWQ